MRRRAVDTDAVLVFRPSCIVDLDSRLVERWRPDDERPEIMSEVEVDLVAYFADVLDL